MSACVGLVNSFSTAFVVSCLASVNIQMNPEPVHAAELRDLCNDGGLDLPSRVERPFPTAYQVLLQLVVALLDSVHVQGLQSTLPRLDHLWLRHHVHQPRRQTCPAQLETVGSHRKQRPHNGSIKATVSLCKS